MRDIKKYRNLRKALLCCAVAAWITPMTAAAQSTPKPTPQANTDESDDIVVTANKRPERAQDVPASISVVGGQQLRNQNLTSLTDYAATIPGLAITNNGSPARSAIVLRGIASTGTGALVGTYLDDSPVGSSASYNISAFTALDLPPAELQQLEVLRGPQGTLYGASTMGGLLKYVLTPASTTKFAVQAGADLATVNSSSSLQASGRAAVNLPLVDGLLGMRVSAFETHTPGYIDNGVTGSRDVNSGDSYGGRVALTFTPTTTIDAKLNALLFRSEYADSSYLTYSNPLTQTRSDGTYVVYGGTRDPGLSIADSIPYKTAKHLDFFSLNVDWAPGPVKITSGTSYAYSESLFQLDETLVFGPYLPLFTGGAVTNGKVAFPITSPLKKFTQELRIASPDGDHPIEWMIGGFYTNERARLYQKVFAYDSAGQPVASLQPDFGHATLISTYKELAVFANLTVRLTSKFDVSGGLRYSHNDQTFAQTTGGPLFGVSTINNTSSESVTTWMVNARYRFSPDAMIYARVATGYRPGGPNVAQPGSGIPPTFAADSLTNYEAGAKFDFADRKGFINLSAFYIDWKNIQLSLFQGGFSYFGNGGTAHSTGFEASTSYTPFRGFTVAGNVAYTDSKLVSAQPGSYIATGYQLPGVPKWAFALSGSYDWQLGRAKAHIGANGRWVGKEWSSALQYLPHASPAVLLPSYALFDLDASVTTGLVTWKVFVRNVTNKRAYQGAFIVSSGGNALQTNYAINQPRTIGVGFDVAL